MSILKVKFPDAPLSSTSNDTQVNLPLRPRLSAVGSKQIWAIGGGKGGIGKTVILSNIAVYLSWLSKKITVVDLDLGGANLHTSFGLSPSDKTLSDVVSGRVENLQDLVQQTPIANVSLISGANDSLEINGLRQAAKAKLLKKIRDLDSDFILFDLGAGTAPTTIDFFLFADKKIIVTTPEPTSIENAYRFIKYAYYRMLRNVAPSTTIKQLVEQVMDPKNDYGIKSPRELINAVTKLSRDEGKKLETYIKQFKIHLVLNQVRMPSETELGKSIPLVCEKYFGITTEYAGHLPYDNAVWQSIRRRKPFLIDAPNSEAVTRLEELLRNLLKA